MAITRSGRKSSSVPKEATGPHSRSSVRQAGQKLNPDDFIEDTKNGASLPKLPRRSKRCEIVKLEEGESSSVDDDSCSRKKRKTVPKVKLEETEPKRMTTATPMGKALKSAKIEKPINLNVEIEKATDNSKQSSKQTATSAIPDHITKRIKLIEMSNSIKPSYYNNINSKFQNHPRNNLRTSADIMGLPIKLSKDNKLKINSVTNYNPIRLHLLDQRTKECKPKDIKQLKELIEKPTTLNGLKLPSHKEDLILQKALASIKSDFISSNLTDNEYLKEELSLQQLNLNPFDKQIYSTYLKYNHKPPAYEAKPSGLFEGRKYPNQNNRNYYQGSAGNTIKDESLIPNFYIELNSLQNLRFKDLVKESRRFDLINMIAELNVNPKKYNDINESTAFDDLTFADIATVRSFDDFQML